jgi:very-short-patch-repair endonuclease
VDEVDRRIAAVARRQQDNITREQLLRLGLGKAAIAYRARTGRLHREHRGVYSVGRRARTPLERACAAVLACGPRAALSHQSAFTLWGFDRHWRFPVHVSSPTCREHPGIVTHRVPALARRDVRTERGIRVTSPARTFLDHAPTMSREQLRRAFADARRSGHLKPTALHDILDRNPNHPGRTPLLKAFTGHQPTRSVLEDTFRRFCRQHDLPVPLINVKLNGYEVDAYFPGHDVIVELDGWDYHQDRHSFEDDRDRDADQLAVGTPTLRVTWERITETPAKEARRLKQILAARGPMP